MSAAPEPPARRGRPETTRTGGVRSLLLVSAAFLALQVSLTDYGGPTRSGAAALWLGVGLLLLWLVWRRRSRVARAVVVVTALAGAVVFGLGAARSWEAALLTMTYLGQALPLLAVPVRRHVQAPPRRAGPESGLDPAGRTDTGS